MSAIATDLGEYVHRHSPSIVVVRQLGRNFGRNHRRSGQASPDVAAMPVERAPMLDHARRDREIVDLNNHLYRRAFRVAGRAMAQPQDPHARASRLTIRVYAFASERHFEATATRANRAN
jgi:hypothetical protein